MWKVVLILREAPDTIGVLNKSYTPKPSNQCCTFVTMNVVQAFILDQRPAQKQIMTVLRTWVLDLGSHTTEKISYKVPFFYFYGPLCYVSPTVDGVDLCFTQGASLSKTHKQLKSKGRKTVASMRIHSLAELEEHEDEIRRILNEAEILNQYLFNQKKKKK